MPPVCTVEVSAAPENKTLDNADSGKRATKQPSTNDQIKNKSKIGNQTQNRIAPMEASKLALVEEGNWQNWPWKKNEQTY